MNPKSLFNSLFICLFLINCTYASNQPLCIAQEELKQKESSRHIQDSGIAKSSVSKKHKKNGASHIGSGGCRNWPLLVLTAVCFLANRTAGDTISDIVADDNIANIGGDMTLQDMMINEDDGGYWGSYSWHNAVAGETEFHLTNRYENNSARYDVAVSIPQAWMIKGHLERKGEAINIVTASKRPDKKKVHDLAHISFNHTALASLLTGAYNMKYYIYKTCNYRFYPQSTHTTTENTTVVFANIKIPGNPYLARSIIDINQEQEATLYIISTDVNNTIKDVFDIGNNTYVQLSSTHRVIESFSSETNRFALLDLIQFYPNQDTILPEHTPLITLYSTFLEPLNVVKNGQFIYTLSNNDTQNDLLGGSFILMKVYHQGVSVYQTAQVEVPGAIASSLSLSGDVLLVPYKNTTNGLPYTGFIDSGLSSGVGILFGVEGEFAHCIGKGNFTYCQGLYEHETNHVLVPFNIKRDTREPEDNCASTSPLYIKNTNANIWEIGDTFGYNYTRISLEREMFNVTLYKNSVNDILICQGTLSPTHSPECATTGHPTLRPTPSPTTKPSQEPSIGPSKKPSTTPTIDPTNLPTLQPSTSPSMAPTVNPSKQPSTTPTIGPTKLPTLQPSTSPSIPPTVNPSKQPSTTPTINPTKLPTIQPSTSPSIPPTVNPSKQPSTTPTINPTKLPTIQPSTSPSIPPTVNPSKYPSIPPTVHPSNQPSIPPTVEPSKYPTLQPSRFPSTSPTVNPTEEPSTLSKEPTISPTKEPSTLSEEPTSLTLTPSTTPSEEPTVTPSITPTTLPTIVPSNATSSGGAKDFSKTDKGAAIISTTTVGVALTIAGVVYAMYTKGCFSKKKRSFSDDTEIPNNSMTDLDL